MKYCSPECRKIVSQGKINRRYKRIKAIQRGEVRHCTHCGVRLSRYNQQDSCSACDSSRSNTNLSDIIKGINESGK